MLNEEEQLRFVELFSKVTKIPKKEVATFLESNDMSNLLKRPQTLTLDTKKLEKIAELNELRQLMHVGLQTSKELINTPQSVYNNLIKFADRTDKEYFIAMFLNVKNRIIKTEVISIGTVNASLINVKEITKKAVLCDAANIIVSHNHPSGDTKPSSNDIEATKRIYTALKMVDVELLDHIILGEGSFLSLREQGMFDNMPQLRSVLAENIENNYMAKRKIEISSEGDTLDTPEKLAKDLDEFSYYNDPYGYMDTIADRGEQVKTLITNIVNADTETIKEYLKEIIDEGEPEEEVVSAIALIKRIEKFEDEVIERASTKEPSVTILWSESPHLDQTKIYSLSEANKLFGELDLKQRTERENPNYAGLHYHKTKFKIKYLDNGKMQEYVGRQDFGDGDGNLIDHIRGGAAYVLKDKEQLKFLKRANPEEYKQTIQKYEHVVNKFVPYLVMHCNLTEIEQDVKASMGLIDRKSSEKWDSPDQMAYGTAMLKYVADSRENHNLNIREKHYIEPPKMENFIGKNQNVKLSIKERLAVNKVEVEKKKNEPKLVKAVEKKEEIG